MQVSEFVFLQAGMPQDQLGQVLPEGMTITTLFSKYTEAVEGWRSEQLKNRRNELILEQARSPDVIVHATLMPCCIQERLSPLSWLSVPCHATLPAAITALATAAILMCAHYLAPQLVVCYTYC